MLALDLEAQVDFAPPWHSNEIFLDRSKTSQKMRNKLPWHSHGEAMPLFRLAQVPGWDLDFYCGTACVISNYVRAIINPARPEPTTVSLGYPLLHDNMHYSRRVPGGTNICCNAITIRITLQLPLSSSWEFVALQAHNIEQLSITAKMRPIKPPAPKEPDATYMARSKDLSPWHQPCQHLRWMSCPSCHSHTPS